MYKSEKTLSVIRENQVRVQHIMTHTHEMVWSMVRTEHNCNISDQTFLNDNKTAMITNTISYTLL